MTVLGFSSSALKDGNVDRMVSAVLEKCRRPSEFIRLPELSYGPCRACVHLCAKDNHCRLEDELEPLYSKLVSAEAIVLGTPVYFDNMNGFMSVFLERLWAFRHQRFPLADKPFFVVSTGDKLDGAEKAVESVRCRMTAYRAVFAGSITFGSTIFPCYSCGYGRKCKVGGFYDRYGDEGITNLKITPEVFKRWEDSPAVAAEVEKMAGRIAGAAESLPNC